MIDSHIPDSNSKGMMVDQRQDLRQVTFFCIINLNIKFLALIVIVGVVKGEA